MGEDLSVSIIRLDLQQATVRLDHHRHGRSLSPPSVIGRGAGSDSDMDSLAHVVAAPLHRGRFATCMYEPLRNNINK